MGLCISEDFLCCFKGIRREEKENWMSPSIPSRSDSSSTFTLIAKAVLQAGACVTVVVR